MSGPGFLSIKALSLCINLCASVKLDNLPCSYPFLINTYLRQTRNIAITNQKAMTNRKKLITTISEINKIELGKHLHINGKFTMGKNENICFLVKFRSEPALPVNF